MVFHGDESDSSTPESTGHSSGSSGGGDSGDGSFSGFNSTITLQGSHFHAPVPMATLVVSGVCLLSFIGIIIWYAWVKGKNKQTKKLLSWPKIGVSTLFMILYFGLDVTDRILHEMEMKVTPLYFRISIPLETFTLFGDLLLLTFLLLYLAPALLDHAGISDQHSTFIRMAHAATLMILLIVFIADRITFIYKSVTDQFLTPADIYAASSTNSQLGQIIGAYPKLNTAFYGLYLSGAISITAISTIVVLRLHKAQVLHRTFLVFLPLIVGSLILRTIVNFIYALYFKLLQHPQSLTFQLVHMLFYGVLSVIIYVSCLKVASTEEDWDSIVSAGRGNVEYGPVNGNFQDWRQQQQYQQKLGVVSMNETGSHTSVSGSTGYGGGNGNGHGHVQGHYAYEYRPQHYGHVQ